MIDLHMHTDVSDGEFSPEEVVNIAIKKGLKAIAITDHDTTIGINAAIEYAKGRNIEIVPGIEIYCYEEDIGFDEVHILGLVVEHENKDLIKFTEILRQDRFKQKRKIISKLRNLGFDVKLEDIPNVENVSIGKPHIALELIKKYPKEFSSVREVFDRYLGVGKPAYSERSYKVRITEAINIIKKAGGVSFLAHPGCYADNDALELINIFTGKGGQGIETIYPYDLVFPKEYDKIKTERKILFFKDIAKKLGLVESGGSDFNGKVRKSTIGCVNVDNEILRKIKNILNKNSSFVRG